MIDHIHQSNLIEDIDDHVACEDSFKAWLFLETLHDIAIADLLKLHHMITRKQLGAGESGAYRTVDVTVGGRLCPEPFLAQQMAYNWLLDMIDHKETLDPKEMHVRFEKIHPFVDGNGRTGRMLMWWHELQLKKRPTLIKFNERQKYYEWFK